MIFLDSIHCISRKYRIFLGFFGFILVVLFIFGGSFFHQEVQYTLLEKVVEGNSMHPLIESGYKIKFIPEYYTSNIPKAGDIIGYNYGGNKHMLIKMIRASSDDRVNIVGNTITINGKEMLNSAGESYRFSLGELHMLALYIQDGKIPEGSYFIFGDNTSDSIDSRKFGAISRNGMLGKFLFPE